MRTEVLLTVKTEDMGKFRDRLDANDIILNHGGKQRQPASVFPTQFHWTFEKNIHWVSFMKDLTELMNDDDDLLGFRINNNVR